MKNTTLTQLTFTDGHVLPSQKGAWAVDGVAVAAGRLLEDRLGGTALCRALHVGAVIPSSEYDNWSLPLNSFLDHCTVG